ncbi:MAG TPA: hypothetical protein VJH92_04885 [Candidatus Nanoarchaeia archaeon]|nr:hypothetical protein [Candidatus Nanoarchaeia archaeon]
MSYKIGFSTGTLHKSLDMCGALEKIREISSIVELNFVRDYELTYEKVSKLLTNDLDFFDYVSLHAPAVEYYNDEKSERIFKEISRIDKARKLDHVVFHPDQIRDFSIFHDLPFNVAMENMDCRKKSCKSPKDLERVLSLNSKWGFVLDVNHAYTLDRTMDLANSFYESVGDRLVEIHLSGYGGYHEPLFKLKQEEIVKSIRDFSKPIIIESILDSEELQEELDYVLRFS